MATMVVLQDEPDLLQIPDALGIPCRFTTSQAQSDKAHDDEKKVPDAQEVECPPPMAE